MCSASVQGLATNGIINFNPDTYIRDGYSNYVGAQEMELPFDRPLYATPFLPQGFGYMNPGQPHRDMYVPTHEKHSSTSWTGILLGAVLGGVAAYLGYNYFKDKETPAVKPLANGAANAGTAGAADAAKTEPKGFLAEVKDSVVGAKDKAVDYIKGKTNGGEVDKVLNEAARNSSNEQKGFFKSTRFYKTKIAAGIAAGAVAVYALYRLFAGKSHNAQPQPNGGGH